MDVLTVIKGCDPSFGFGIWKETEVVTEIMVLLDSREISLSAKSNVALTPQVTFPGERKENSF